MGSGFKVAPLSFLAAATLTLSQSFNLKKVTMRTSVACLGEEAVHLRGKNLLDESDR